MSLPLQPLANPALGSCKLKRAISVSCTPLCEVALSPSIFSSMSDEDNNGAHQQHDVGSSGWASQLHVHRTLSPGDVSGVSGDGASLRGAAGPWAASHVDESVSMNGGVGMMEEAWGVCHASPQDELAPMNSVNAFYPC